MSQLDYGLIGNCQVSALVNKTGKVAWCCMPRFDSPSIFASLLDEDKGGFWSIEPAGPIEDWEVRQYYMRNTNVLVTSFTGSHDAFEIIDFMPRFEKTFEFHRPAQMARIVRPLKGIPRIVVRCKPRFEYGKEEPKAVELASEIRFEGANQTVFLQTDAPIAYVLRETAFELKESKHFVLAYGERFSGGNLKFDLEEQLDRTIAYWRNWAKHCNIPFEFQNALSREELGIIATVGYAMRTSW
jgi:GH15 family glucan-1,4-alpha-glucosidase